MGNAIRRATPRWQKQTFAPFHRAGHYELRATSLSGQAEAFDRLLWTPNIQRVKPDLCFLEFLEELKYTKRANIFDKSATADDIRALVVSFIKEAFTEAELAEMNCEHDRIFEPTPASAFFGRVDFFLHHPASNRYLAVFVHEKTEDPDHNGSYFTLGAYAPDVFFDYMIKSYNIGDNLMVLTTNGHYWQLFGLEPDFRVKPTKALYGRENGLLFDDGAIVQAVLGMIRYPLIRFENELLLDQITDYFEHMDHSVPKRGLKTNKELTK